MFEIFLEKLKKQSQLDYQQLHQYFQSKLDSQEYYDTYSRLIKLIQTNKEIQQTLSETGKVRLKKEQYELPRTIQIFTDSNNELFALLETKNKLKGGVKRSDKDERNKRYQSSTKRMYHAFDLTPKEGRVGDVKNMFASLAFYKGFDESDIKEAEITNRCKAGTPIFYSRYKTSSKEKLSFYSRLGEPLRTFLYPPLYPKLNYRDKQNIFYGILDELHISHKNNIIHQDLKQENIIVYQINNQFHVKITDFGCCNHSISNSSATAGYESPEMFSSGALIRLYPDRYRALMTLSMVLFNLNFNRANYKVCEPNEKNDMWALGVIYLKLMYMPLLPVYNIATNKEALRFFIKGLTLFDDILAKLLVKERNARCTTEEFYNYVAFEHNRNKSYSSYMHEIGIALANDLDEIKKRSLMMPSIASENIENLSKTLKKIEREQLGNLAILSKLLNFTTNIIQHYRQSCFLGNISFLESEQYILALIEVLKLQNKISSEQKFKILQFSEDLSDCIGDLKLIFSDNILNKLISVDQIKEEFNQIQQNNARSFKKRKFL